MSGPDASPLRRWHRLLEHYTPDGTLGRLVLGGPLLFLAPILFFGGFATFAGAISFPLFLVGLLVFGASIPAAVVGVVCLWPVYLRLIGNVESPEAYPDGTGAVRSTAVDGDDAEATLKRRYAEGEITHEEFEARLDALFDADERGRGHGRREPSGERRETESAR